MKRIILAVVMIIAVLVCSVSVAGDTPVVTESLGSVPFTSDTITINGIRDAIYEKGLKLQIESSLGGMEVSGATGTAYFLRSDDTLYVCVEVTGEAEYLITDDYESVCWGDDHVELIINRAGDGDMDSCEEYASGVNGHFYYNWEGEQLFGSDADSDFQTECVRNDTSYTVEYAIPLDGQADKLDIFMSIVDTDSTGSDAGYATLYDISSFWSAAEYNYIELNGDEVSAPATTTTTTTAGKSEDLSDEQKEAIDLVLGDTEITVKADDKLSVSANNVAEKNEYSADTKIADGKTASSAVTELASNNEAMGTVSDENPVKVAVVAYLDVEVTNATVESSDEESNTITVNIVPKAQTVATTKKVLDDSDIGIVFNSDNGNDNAVAIGEPEKLEINTPLDITIGIPESMVKPDSTGGYMPIYVIHVKEETGISYVYTAEVYKENDYYYATFTNPHGFSEFKLTSEQVTVASIGTTEYADLQSAVNAVEDNETITLSKDVTDTAYVNKEVSFYLVNSDYTCNIQAGEGYTLTTSENGLYTVTAKQDEPEQGDEPDFDYDNIFDWFMLAVNNRRFDITASSGEDGTITPEGTTRVLYGRSQKYIIIPNEGYEVAAVIVDGEDIGKVTEYTFKAVTKSHTISVKFEKIPWQNPFVDISANDWFYEDIQFVYENDLMIGTDIEAGLFSPEKTLNRATILTTLWRLAGSPIVELDTDFTDLPEDWYTDAMKWAISEEIILGYGDGTCRPMTEITHEQVIAILHRFMVSRGYEGEPITLSAQIIHSEWAENDVLWAIANNLFDGFGSDVSDLTKTANRAEIAAYLSRLCELIEE